MCGLEFHADNTSPFFKLETQFEAKDPGWDGRVVALIEQAAARREALAKEGIEVPAVIPPLRDSFPNELGWFAAALWHVGASMQGPMKGLIAVIAPTRVDSAEPLVSSLRWMLSVPELSEVRFVVVESDSTYAAALAKELRGAASLARFDVDEQALVDELGKTVEPTADGGSAGMMARPRVTPPRRIDDPPVPTRESLEQALAGTGISPDYVLGGGERLRDAVMRGALAARKGDFLAAVRLQREAVDLCGELGMVAERVTMQILLASYALHLRQPQKAHELYEQAARWASEANLPKSEAQARMATAMLCYVGRDFATAGRMYTDAAALLRDAGETVLAIECLRLAGECGAALERPDLAASAWTEALTLADGLEPREAKATTAIEAGRALAQVLRRRGLIAQAQAVEEHTVRLKEGTPAIAPA